MKKWHSALFLIPAVFIILFGIFTVNMFWAIVGAVLVVIGLFVLRVGYIKDATIQYQTA